MTGFEAPPLVSEATLLSAVPLPLPAFKNFTLFFLLKLPRYLHAANK